MRCLVSSGGEGRNKGSPHNPMGYGATIGLPYNSGMAMPPACIPYPQPSYPYSAYPQYSYPYYTPQQPMAHQPMAHQLPAGATMSYAPSDPMIMYSQNNMPPQQPAKEMDIQQYPQQLDQHQQTPLNYQQHLPMSYQQHMAYPAAAGIIPQAMPSMAPGQLPPQAMPMQAGPYPYHQPQPMYAYPSQLQAMMTTPQPQQTQSPQHPHQYTPYPQYSHQQMQYVGDMGMGHGQQGQLTASMYPATNIPPPHAMSSLPTAIPQSSTGMMPPQTDLSLYAPKSNQTTGSAPGLAGTPANGPETIISVSGQKYAHSNANVGIISSAKAETV